MEFEVTALTSDVYRIETIAGERIHAYHAFETEAGVGLVDTAFDGARDSLFQPALKEIGYDLKDISMAIITHADADHHGGNGELREEVPGLTILSHEADAPLIESTDALLEQRYRQFESDHDVGYDQGLLEDLREMVSGDTPVDVRLKGGETLSTAESSLRVLHTPGHTPGHIMLYDAANGVLLGGDGFFRRGIPDVNDEMTQPAPYHIYDGYMNTLGFVDILTVGTLSFTHYPVFDDDEIDDILAESYDFTAEIDGLLDDLLEETDQVTLTQAVDAAVDRIGPYGLNVDYSYPLSAHLTHRRENGTVSVVDGSDPIAFQQA